MAVSYSFHNKAAYYLLLGMALGRRFYTDQYFLQEQQTVFDQYSTSTSAVIKLAYNVVGPILFAYAAAAIHESINKSLVARRQSATAALYDDEEAQRRRTLISVSNDDDASGTLDTATEWTHFQFNQTHAYLTLAFSALVAQVPTMIQGFSSNPYPETVLQAERVAALNPVTIPIFIGMMLGITDLIFHKKTNPTCGENPLTAPKRRATADVNAMSFSVTCFFSAKLGPLLMLPAIAIHNMKGLEVIGKTMGPWGMLAFTGLLPAALALTKVTAVSRMLDKPAIKRNAGLITALAASNYVSEWLFGNVGNVLQLTNHTYAAREESKFGMLLLSQIALMAVTTGIVLLGKKAVDACQTSPWTLGLGPIRDGE